MHGCTLKFIVYINSLAKLELSYGTSIVLYADNILLYRALASSNDNAQLQHDVDKVDFFIWPGY